MLCWSWLAWPVKADCPSLSGITLIASSQHEGSIDSTKYYCVNLGMLGRCRNGNLWTFYPDCFYIFFFRKVGNRVMGWDEDRKELSWFEKIRKVRTNCRGEKYWQIILRIFFCYRWNTWSRIIQRINTQSDYLRRCRYRCRETIMVSAISQGCYLVGIHW